jgi:glyoxylase-like metal-dependent hydrolase (beta-lactamase superfamily II)
LIHHINLLIANVYLIIGAKPVLVDTGAPGGAGRIQKALAQRGVQAKELALILLTHGHFDHAGSAKALRDALGVPIAVHQGDAAMVEQGDNGPLVPLGLEANLMAPMAGSPWPGFKPDVLLDDQSDLSAYGLDARLLHTPGHSPGSISLLFPNGDAIIGDILRGGWLGGVIAPARPARPYFLPELAQVSTLRQSIQRVLDAGARRLYVGHGGPLDAEAVRRWLAGNPGL